MGGGGRAARRLEAFASTSPSLAPDSKAVALPLWASAAASSFLQFRKLHHPRERETFQHLHFPHSPHSRLANAVFQQSYQHDVDNLPETGKKYPSNFPFPHNFPINTTLSGHGKQKKRHLLVIITLLKTVSITL